MTGPVDFFASMPHYRSHLEPIWQALPEDLRGSWRRHPTDGTASVVVVASARDSIACGATDVVLVEHGAGQAYPVDNPSYSGGSKRDNVALFLCPNEVSADRNRSAYPDAAVEVVGSPRVDALMALAEEPSGDVVALTHHWDCLPSDAVVSGPRPTAASSRWYEGELVKITTASGHELSVTPNHPVLTPHGWVAAERLHIGDDVVGCRSGEGVLLADPDDVQSPTRIEEITAAFEKASSVLSVCVPTASEDFHGDGIGSKVAVVSADCQLWSERNSSIAQPLIEQPLIRSDLNPAPLASQRSQFEAFLSFWYATNGIVGSGSQSQPLCGCHLSHTQHSGLGCCSNNSAFAEQGIDWVCRNIETRGHRGRAFALSVTLDDLVFMAVGAGASTFHDVTLGTWSDAPSIQCSIHGSPSDSEVNGESRPIFASEIAHDEVVNLARHQFAGHVHSLTTRPGWYVADGIVVKNCNLCPETRWAQPHFWSAYSDIVGRFDVIGHGHPRYRFVFGNLWKRLGIEHVERFEDVLSRARLLVADNTSAMYEWAALDRPVVVLNPPWYRRDIEAWPRFWACADVGIQVDRAGVLCDAIAMALDDPPAVAERRRAVVDEIFPFRDGKAAERAAHAIERFALAVGSAA